MGLHLRLRELLSGSFIRDVAKLSLGTIVGRLIAVAALPLLTRLYSPEDFALLATFLALVSIVSVAACLRLEIAIPLAETDMEAAEILAIALIVLAVVVLNATLLVLLIPEHISSWLGSPKISSCLWLVPVGVVLSGSYSAFQYWTTRLKRFNDIACTRISQAVIGVTAALVTGWLGLTPFGLLIGNMLNTGAGGISLAVRSLRKDDSILRTVSIKNFGETLRRNRRYPIYSTPEALCNIAGLQIPVLLVAAYADAEAGFLLIAMQLMTTPLSLLGSSISQVYISRAPQEYRDGTLGPFTLKIMQRLALVGIGPLTLAGVIAPFVFPAIFGEDWVRTGEIVAWLVPWMALQFIASTVSMVMYVVGYEKSMLLLTTVGMIIRIGMTWLAVVTSAQLVEYFAIGSAVFYSICVAFFLKASFKKNHKVII